jgi:quercetin dioxygenase-like cupin family protein
MQIWRAGTRPTRPAPAEYFTGQVLQDPIIESPAPARARALRVTFLPGGRTHWHTHPFGQCLHVLSGSGLFQSRGQRAVAIHPGDTLWIAPGEEHWHGAAATTAMVHLALQEADEAGQTARWLEAVSEADYATAQATAVSTG